MSRIKCIVAYDGMNFAGYQRQPRARTVQGEIEKLLSRMMKEDVVIHGSGRTDAGVHSKGQVFHFDTKLDLSEDKWLFALNSQLPEDIYIKSVERVSEEFHARYSAVRKEYRYRVSLKKERDVFAARYVYHYPYDVDITKIQEASQYFIGTHDFTLFSSAKSTKEDKVRTIYEVRVEEQGEELELVFIGNGFLYNMVRILVATLLEVGQGRYEPIQVKEVLEGQREKLKVKTAPGHGLYLWEVSYAE